MLPDYISTFLAVLSLAGGAVAWYSTLVKQRYGFERDVNHLKRDYQQLSLNVETLVKSYEARLDDLQLDLVKLQARFDVIAPSLAGRLAPEDPT